MTRKLLLVLLATFFAATALAGKAYRAERFDVQLNLLPGGDMLVTETVVFRFEGGPFTHAFREISANRTDGLTFLEASMDGVRMPQGTGAGQVEVKPGDPLKITWHFAPTSNATRVFVVRYQVAGVISTDQANILRWYVIPSDHGYSIDQSTIWLNYPAGVRPLEPPSLDRPCSSVPTDKGFKLTTTGIASDEGVILTARFPANSLTKTLPRWQAREQEIAAATARVIPTGIISGLATVLLGGMGLFACIRANRRKLDLPKLPMLSTPPDDRVPPAVVGKLLRQGEVYNAMGALFNLAQRSVVRIREERGRGGQQFVVEIENRNVALSPHEQWLLEPIIKSGKTQVKMINIITRLPFRFSQLLEQELVQRGWLDAERKRKRTTLRVVAWLLLFIGMGIAVGASVALSVFLTSNQTLASVMAVLAGLGGGTAVLFIPLGTWASNYSLLTLEGEKQKARWNSFRAYLDRVSRGVEPAVHPDIFERYIAFAAVFGLGTAWVQYFSQSGGALPDWFHAISDIDSGWSAMSDAFGIADASSFSGGGDGGGASGGGASGAD